MITMNLNGLWEFDLSANRQIPDKFSSFATIPGCFDVRPGEFGKRQSGHYRRKLETPGGMAMLTCNGAGLHTEFFWDGKSIGRSDLPYSQEEFIFDSGTPGCHTLNIVTDNFTPDLPAEQYKVFYDFYGFGGIYSDVELTFFSPADIRHLAVIPLDHRTGKVKVEVETFGEAPEMLDIAFDGKKFMSLPFAKEFTCEVPEFKLWSPDSPELHKISVNGKTTEFGIRILEWNSQQLKLNGKVLKLIGCNRHESHPQFGPATPDQLVVNDLVAIKAEGFNFIRGSHYPQKKIMLDTCDRLGLLVWEETLGWGNKPEELKNKEFVGRQESQCRKMIRKSINHPCVIIWGFLNECASDCEYAPGVISRLMTICHELDFSRPATFASNRPDLDICLDLVDIIAINIYPGWYDSPDIPADGTPRVIPTLKKYAKKFAAIPKPLIVSEIGAAALYGQHGGGRWSEEYQSKLLANVVSGILNIERYTGTALWMYCDTNSYREHSFFFTRPRNFNNKGMLDEYRRPKIAWHNIHRLLKRKGFIKQY